MQPKPPPVPVKTQAKVVAELEEKERKAATYLKILGTSVISQDQTRSSKRTIRDLSQNWKRPGHGCLNRPMRLRLGL